MRPRAGSGALGWNSGDLARCSLNPRVIAGIPLGRGVGGDLSLGSVNAVGGSLGWRWFTGLGEPGYNGGGVGGERGELRG